MQTPTDISRIAAWLKPQDIVLDVEARDRAQAFELAATVIARLRGLEPAPICRALWRREQAGSTALGDGFAIPHTRIEGIARPLTLYMRTREGLPFDAPDGKPVSELLVIVAPTDGAKSDHLALLALVAQLFSDTGFRRALADSTDAQGAAEAFDSGIAQLMAAGG